MPIPKFTTKISNTKTQTDAKYAADTFLSMKYVSKSVSHVTRFYLLIAINNLELKSSISVKSTLIFTSTRDFFLFETLHGKIKVVTKF